MANGHRAATWFPSYTVGGSADSRYGQDYARGSYSVGAATQPQLAGGSHYHSAEPGRGDYGKHASESRGVRRLGIPSSYPLRSELAVSPRFNRGRSWS